MGSNGVDVGGGGGIPDQSMGSLTRQGSLYSLTLDEVHSQIGSTGKPLGSMNLDELLRNVWSVDHGDGIENPSGQYGPGNPLHKQPSFTLSGALCKKTVDEVWKDIQLGKNMNDATTVSDNRGTANRDRQPTLGEITLEDFLSMAGLMAESSDKVWPVSGIFPATVTHRTEKSLCLGQWSHHQLPSVPQQQSFLPLFMSTNHVDHPPLSAVSAAAPFLDTGFSDSQISLSPTSLLGGLSDMQAPGHKRVVREGIVVEKTVERRQKRMIKNRESAARSRARKQAYTQELENKVAFLEEENARLRKQRDLDKPTPPAKETKKKLRRTSSAPEPL
ncbi:hypothetical protein MLD38_015898 [Melastoma candidum]|uniref:Uncharacterized protein n=1 Tax=Melastoma candidum TaxID=119954 RepID=A0ACB9RHI6_9MYRT|nr:hypothetical protein MLD38_015898 [Melastoma candidum]